MVYHIGFSSVRELVKPDVVGSLYVMVVKDWALLLRCSSNSNRSQVRVYAGAGFAVANVLRPQDFSFSRAMQCVDVGQTATRSMPLMIGKVSSPQQLGRLATAASIAISPTATRLPSAPNHNAYA